MKRFTRMLSATLALATVCAASFIPASAKTATGFSGTTSPDGIANKITTLPIKSTYSIPKAGLIPEAKFIYTLASDDTVTSSTYTDDNHLVTAGSALFEDDLTDEWEVKSQYRNGTTDVPTTMTNTALAIDFKDLPTDAKTGIYRFTLTESLDKDMKKNANATYSSTEYRVDVYVQGEVKAVEADEEKGIKAVEHCDAYIYLIKVYQKQEDKDDDGNVTKTTWFKADPEFANSIDAVEDLIIKNYVDNTVTSEDVGFNITLQILPGSDESEGVTLEAGTDLHAYVTLKDGTQVECNGQKIGDRTFSEIKVNKEGEVTNFVLYNGESLTVPSLPINLVYTTTNSDANKQGFTSTYNTAIGTKADGITDKDEPKNRTEAGGYVPAGTVASDGTTTPVTVVDQDIAGDDNNTIIRVGQNMIIYHNVNQAVGETGVTMDSVPYVVMFLAAAAIAVLAVAKKKTNR